jgi:hypothetical protein
MKQNTISKIVYWIFGIIVITIIIVAIAKYRNCKNTSLTNTISTDIKDNERFSYSFGFPTWGSYGQSSAADAIRLYGSVGPGTPLQGYNEGYTPYPAYMITPIYQQPRLPVWSAFPYGNPFLWRDPNTLNYWENIAPYLNKPCYSSSKDDDCVPGYYKTRFRYKHKHIHFDSDSSLKSTSDSSSSHHDKKRHDYTWKCCRY